ncbi:hypothetical protein PCYB_061790, partial [Plasmodium cynomolgi strain B]
GDANASGAPQTPPCYYGYCSLVVPSDHSSDDNGSTLSDNVKRFLNLYEDEEMENIKKRLRERKTRGGKIATRSGRTGFTNDGPSRGGTQTNRYAIITKESKPSESRRGRRNIRELINLEKEIIVTRTLLQKKKSRLDDIYSYTSRREKVIKNLNLSMSKEASFLQDSLVDKFKRTEELIRLLTDNFNLLEEQHLQLIDDTQNTEYELEEYEKKLADKKKEFLTRTNDVMKKIVQMEGYIKDHTDQIGEYENAIKKNQSEISFDKISSKIDFICAHFNYDVNTNDVMKKLQIMENNMYAYISTLTKYTEENSQLVYEYQRECEQERRKQMRFEINLDRKGNNQSKQLKSTKTTNKAFGTNQKEVRSEGVTRRKIHTINKISFHS